MFHIQGVSPICWKKPRKLQGCYYGCAAHRFSFQDFRRLPCGDRAVGPRLRSAAITSVFHPPDDLPSAEGGMVERDGRFVATPDEVLGYV
ncbi:MAG: hypothetical protein QM402_02870, partial [Synergistota bacterium]|nr:hypothetical protein [Synergistota bacterium]